MKTIPLLLLLLFAGAAAGEPTGTLIQQLTEAVRAELNDPANRKDPNGNYQYQVFQSIVDIKASYVDDRLRPGSSDQVLKAIGKLETASTSKATQELCRALDKQVRSEFAELQAAEIEKIKKEASSALRAALAARNVRDLDAPLATLASAFSGSYLINDQDHSHQNLISEVSRAEDLLRELQDYLASAGEGTIKTRENQWRNLLSLRTDLTVLLPRSELLAALEEFRKRVDSSIPGKPMTPQEVTMKGWQMVAETKSLEDLDKTNTRIAAWIHSDESAGLDWNSFSPAISTLHQFGRTYAEVKSGTISQLEVASLIKHQADIGNDTLRNLNKQLVLAALAQLLQAPMGTSDETPTAYVQRIAKQAAAAEDWPLYARAMGGMPATNPDSQTPASDRLAVQSFLAGINQFRARQYALAVRSFESALHSGSFAIPSEIIGQQLDKIRQEHPEAFEKATFEEKKSTSEANPHWKMQLAPSSYGVWPGRP